MFCKNCGAEMKGENQICTSCGFDCRDGNGFCQHCGNAVLPRQKLCLHCGGMLDEGTNSASQEVCKKDAPKDNQAHKNSVKKICYYKLILHILCAVFAFAILFLPVFKCEYQMSETEFYQKWGEVYEKYINGELSKKEEERFESLLLSDGRVERKFSYLQETKRILNFMQSDSTDIDEKAIGFTYIGFLFLVIYFSVACIAISMAKVMEYYKKLQDFDNTAMMMYTEINKSGKLDTKVTFWTNTAKMRNCVTMVLSDFAFCFFIKFIFSDGVPAKITQAMQAARYMTSVSGISWGGVITLLILIVSLVLQNIERKEEEALLLDLAKKEKV